MRYMVDGLSYSEYGRLLIQLDRLRHLVGSAPPEYREMLLEDIRDLEDKGLNVDKKLKIVSRVWKAFSIMV